MPKVMLGSTSTPFVFSKVGTVSVTHGRRLGYSVPSVFEAGRECRDDQVGRGKARIFVVVISSIGVLALTKVKGMEH